MNASASNSTRSEIQILPVTTPTLRKAFVDFPWTIYKNDPNWVPPLKREVYTFLDRAKHPFYEFGFAQAFLALRDGQPVGRVLAADDPVTNKRKETNLGTWGMFECVEDPQVAKALLDAAYDWSHKNYGREKIIGPMTFSTNYDMGLLSKGFDTPPKIGMCYNPQYYDRIVRDAGAVKCQGLYAWWFGRSDEMLQKWQKRIDWFQKRSSITYRSFDPTNFEKEILICREVYNTSMRDNWQYAELSLGEMELMAHQMVQHADPNHVFLAFDGEKPVGFSITLPDLNEVLIHLNGTLFPFGFLKFLYYRRKITSCRMLVMCVDPAYRRRGIVEILVYNTLRRGLESGYQGAELGWTYRDNQAVNVVIERCGGIPYKEYELYEYSK